jgi:NAD(P)-dependent dehydrogenase (short-subunit alcohol dehydrogenase family)
MPTENGSFEGKVVFVTGAAAGIGRAAALAFAHEGASVVAADVSDRGAQETAHLVEQAGARALAVRCDVARVEDVKAALDDQRALPNRRLVPKFLDFAASGRRAKR